MICTFSEENVSGACPSHSIDTGATTLPQRLLQGKRNRPTFYYSSRKVKACCLNKLLNLGAAY